MALWVLIAESWIFFSPTEYGAEVFIIIAVIAIAVITLAIVLPVVLCKRKKAKKARAVREKELLNGV